MNVFGSHRDQIQLHLDVFITGKQGLFLAHWANIAGLETSRHRAPCRTILIFLVMVCFRLRVRNLLEVRDPVAHFEEMPILHVLAVTLSPNPQSGVIWHLVSTHIWIPILAVHIMLKRQCKVDVLHSVVLVRTIIRDPLHRRLQDLLYFQVVKVLGKLVLQVIQYFHQGLILGTE